MRVIFARKSFGLLKHLYYSNLYPSNFNTNPTRIIEIKRNCRRNSKHILDLPRAEYHTVKIMPFKTLRSVFQPCFSNSWIRISTLGHRFPIEFSPSKRPLRIYVTEISPDITPRCHKPFHMYIRDIYIYMCVCVYTLVKKSHFPSETKSIQLAIDRKARAFERKIDAISPGSHRSSCCSPMRFRSKFNVSFANLEDFRSLMSTQVN